jgi:hypothetical protein
MRGVILAEWTAAGPPAVKDDSQSGQHDDLHLAMG